MQHRNDDMLLFIAIGDAVAAATEFVKVREYPRLFENILRLDGYYQHPTHHDLKPRMYTDDTQMSVAVAEALIEHHELLSGRKVTKKYFFEMLNVMITFHRFEEIFAEAWVRTFHRDPRNGYAKGFQLFLEKTETAKSFLTNIRPYSEKNGACMRAVPLGMIQYPEAILAVAEGQARTTHDTPIGIFSAQVVALMSHFALYRDDPFDRLQDFLEIHLSDSIQLHQMSIHKRWRGPVKSPATNTVHAVFDLLTHCKTLSEVLRGAIQFGGDTDSVAAIALGIASARMPNDLPQVLFDKLENGPYGREYLKTLGKQLMDKYT